MKTIMLIILLATHLFLAGSAFAAKQDNTAINADIQPAQPEDIIVSVEKYADKETVESLIQKLEDPDPFVRVEAVQLLGEIHLEQSLISVSNCLIDENVYVRAYAAEALGKIGNVDISLTLLSLLAALDDPSPYVRAMLVLALGELQDKRVVESITRFLDDDDESVRDMAAWALDHIEKSQ